MADEGIHFNDLPEIVKDKIFCFLGGKSLHVCRQVSSEWDDYILQRIWKVKFNYKILKNHLEANWRNGVGVSRLEYDDVEDNFRGFVECYSSELVAIRTRMGTALPGARIQIYNVLDKSKWEVPNPFQHVAQFAQFQSYKLSLSDSLLGIRVLLTGPGHFENLQVFSLDSKSRILNENIPLLNHVQTARSKEDSKIMVIFTKHHIEMWSFEHGTVPKKFRVSVDNTFFTEGSFLFPHIVQMLDFPDTDTTAIRVWKINKNPDSLEAKVNILDMDQFFHFQIGTFEKCPVEEVVYLNDAFLVCCQVPLPGAPRGCTMLCFRICDNRGLIIKQYMLPEFSPDAFIKISTFEQRLIITVDRTVLIYNDDITNLCDASFKKPIQFNTIDDLPGNTELMIRKTEAQTVQLVTFFGGLQMLRKKVLDFWSTD